MEKTPLIIFTILALAAPSHLWHDKHSLHRNLRHCPKFQEDTMSLSRSLALKLTRSVGACLAMLAASTLLDRAILMPAAAQVPPAPAAASTPLPEGAAAPRRPRPPLTPTVQAALKAMRAPLDRLTPVTGEMLRNPPPGDWLHWHRTYDGWANSPLTQINRDTVIWKFLPNQF